MSTRRGFIDLYGPTVADLTRQGVCNKCIAAELHLGTSTISVYRRQLGVHGRRDEMCPRGHATRSKHPARTCQTPGCHRKVRRGGDRDRHCSPACRQRHGWHTPVSLIAPNVTGYDTARVLTGEERRAAVVRLTENGLTAAEVAERTGVTARTVYRDLAAVRAAA